MNPEDVARFPLPGTASPISLSFSPDDNILSYPVSYTHLTLPTIYSV